MKEKKKFYVVTGGASGIGAACVKKLANLGVNVFLCDKDVKRGTRLAERVSRESGQAVTFLQIDLGDPSAVEKAWINQLRGNYR